MSKIAKIDCNRGDGPASSTRKSVGATAETINKFEERIFDRGEKTASSCADAVERLAPIEKKRLIDLERRAQFQRLGGAIR